MTVKDYVAFTPEEIDKHDIQDVSKVLTEGETIKVKLVGIDPKSGKFKLSRKVLMPKPE